MVTTIQYSGGTPDTGTRALRTTAEWLDVCAHAMHGSGETMPDGSSPTMEQCAHAARYNLCYVRMGTMSFKKFPCISDAAAVFGLHTESELAVALANTEEARGRRDKADADRAARLAEQDRRDRIRATVDALAEGDSVDIGGESWTVRDVHMRGWCEYLRLARNGIWVRYTRRTLADELARVKT